IRFVPAATQPFKTERTITPAHHRWAMAALATSGDVRLTLSDIELMRGSISYTVDTLEELRAAHPGSSLEWVIGDDNLELLVKWRNLERILELANFVVLRREERAIPAAFEDRVVAAAGRPRAGTVIPVPSPLVPISATEIRARVGRGEPISGLVAPAVEEYILKYGLYGAEEHTWRTRSSGA
ncbi:MAG TPA: nicotinate (nicotinamide) nucleotide adenylyltransferase, partial [Thermoanaerobaculia bacterium]|nr:nicotinate (nicotinamide) nucleotide adenylyltransferase [Thermoanaerobaculia bacterium]